MAESRTKLSFAVADVNFTITSKDNTIILIPDSKGLDSIELIKSKLGKGANVDFRDLIIIRLEKKTGLTFKSNLSKPEEISELATAKQFGINKLSIGPSTA